MIPYELVPAIISVERYDSGRPMQVLFDCWCVIGSPASVCGGRPGSMGLGWIEPLILYR
jgi:hypothetical protein